MILSDEDIKALINGEPFTYGARMPLEPNRKPVQTFSGDGSYLPSGEGVKRTSELLIEPEEVLANGEWGKPFVTRRLLLLEGKKC